MSPSFIPLGAAGRETRACGHGETMELIPIYFYCQTGATADLLPLGAAAAETRAVSVGRENELNPIFEWTPAGVQPD